jgi:hypothetical protein
MQVVVVDREAVEQTEQAAQAAGAPAAMARAQQGRQIWAAAVVVLVPHWEAQAAQALLFCLFQQLIIPAKQQVHQL